MRVLRVVSAAILAALMAGIPAGGQTPAQIDAPKEPPPAGFTGNQYVDSAGCVFIRAGVDGQTTWVPRISRDRKLVCGYQPTVAPGTLQAAAGATSTDAAEPEAAAEPAAAEPEAVPEVVAETAPAVAPAPATASAVPPRTAAKRVAAIQPKAAAPAGKGPVRLVRNGPIAPAATLCLGRIAAAQRYLLSDGRRVTRCAEGAQDEPVAYLNGLRVPGLEVAAGAPSAAETRRALRAHRGAYRVVWQSGETAVGPAAAAPEPAPEPAAGTGRYVQVGVFAEPANAAAAIARLKALGLPVAGSTGRMGGRAVKAILAGPFASPADLGAALAAARRAGYADAYIRG